jgi:hypothetical protein
VTVSATVPPVSAVKACKGEVNARARIAVWVRSVIGIVAAVIDRDGNASSQHEGYRYQKQKIFHLAPPLRTFVSCLSFLIF